MRTVYLKTERFQTFGYGTPPQRGGEWFLFKSIEEYTEWQEGLSPEEKKKEQEKSSKAWNEKQTPRAGNRCKTKNCKGQVVCRADPCSTFRGMSFGLPQCTKCKRIYLVARNAPRVGAEEFRKRLQIPFTI